MKTKEEIETSITRSLIETSKPEMLKYVTSVPYGFNKPNYEAMSLMVYGYNKCQEDMADESIRFAEWILKNKYERCCDNGLTWWGEYNDEISFSTEDLYKKFIESLNKQE